MDDKQLPGTVPMQEGNMGGYREGPPIENAEIMSRNDGATIDPVTTGERPLGHNVPEWDRQDESNRPPSPIGEDPNPKEPS